MGGYFNGSSDFSIHTLKVDNVDGDYIDKRKTIIDSHEVHRATYNQEGAVGVVNDHGIFRGEINYTGGQSASKRRKNEAHRRKTLKIGDHAEHSENYRNESSQDTEHLSCPPISNAKRSGSSFFNDASDFDVARMDIKSTTGSRVDLRTTHVHKNVTNQKIYNQRGAVGVVNGSGTFSGTINYGSSKYPRDSQHESASSGDDGDGQSGSEDGSNLEGNRGRDIEYVQKDAIGMVCDQGRTVNYTPQRISKNTQRQDARISAYDDYFDSTTEQREDVNATRSYPPFPAQWPIQGLGSTYRLSPENSVPHGAPGLDGHSDRCIPQQQHLGEYPWGHPSPSSQFEYDPSMAEAMRAAQRGRGKAYTHDGFDGHPSTRYTEEHRQCLRESVPMLGICASAPAQTPVQGLRGMYHLAPGSRTSVLRQNSPGAPRPDGRSEQRSLQQQHLVSCPLPSPQGLLEDTGFVNGIVNRDSYPRADRLGVFNDHGSPRQQHSDQQPPTIGPFYSASMRMRTLPYKPCYPVQRPLGRGAPDEARHRRQCIESDYTVPPLERCTPQQYVWSKPSGGHTDSSPSRRMAAQGSHELNGIANQMSQMHMGTRTPFPTSPLLHH